MRIICYCLLLAGLLMLTGQKAQKAYLVQLDDRVKKMAVELHNKYRKEVGVPPVTWSEEVYKSAAQWALHLAENNGLRMKHATYAERHPYGENLSGGPGTWSTDRDAYTAIEWAIISFGNEKKHYHNQPIAMDRNFYKYGHYSQVVWRSTKEVACAEAKRRDMAGYIVVCRYNPAGNTIGKRAY